MKELVTFSGASGYAAGELRPALEKVLAPLLEVRGGVSGKRLMLKPNLLSWRCAEDPAAVHPAFLLECIRLLRDAGAKELAIIENPGMTTAPAIIRAMGIDGELARLGVSVANCADYRKTELSGETGFRSMELAREFGSFDEVVNVAKCKTHAMMSLTLATKNLFGLVRGSERLGWHLAVGKDFGRFADMLLALKLRVAPGINLVDGIVGMEGNGPGSGDPVRLGFVAGGTDALALDDAVVRHLAVPRPILLTRADAHGLIPEYEERGECPPLPAIRLPDPPPPGLAWGVWFPPLVRELLRKKLLPRPVLNEQDCVGCGVCVRMCPPHSLQLQGRRPRFHYDSCIRCFCCQEHCPKGAIHLRTSGWMRLLTGAEKFLRRIFPNRLYALLTSGKKNALPR